MRSEAKDGRMIYCVIPEALAGELYEKLTNERRGHHRSPQVRTPHPRCGRRRQASDPRPAPAPAGNVPQYGRSLLTQSRDDRAVLFVDGGARGNPGPAGVGVVLTDDSGTEIDRANAYIGEATNNVAEYRALLLGLERARALGVRDLEVVNDSQLVARQLTGEYRVKNEELRSLHAQARRALEGFERWSIRSVPRLENELADALVNEAIDARDSTTGR